MNWRRVSLMMSTVCSSQAAVRVGVFPSSENRHGMEYEGSLGSLGAEVMVAQDDAEGTSGVVEALSGLEMVIVPPLHGFTNARIRCHHESVGLYAREIRSWLEAGGILYVDDANYGETLGWLKDVDAGLAVNSTECGAAGAPGHWVEPLAEVVQGPRSVEPSTTWGHMVLPDAEHTGWQVVGVCGHGQPVLMMSRVGAGMVLVSSVRGWEGRVLQNVWVDHVLRGTGLKVVKGELPEIFAGTNTVEVVLRGEGTTAMSGRVAVMVGDERFEKTVEVASGATQRVAVECDIKSRGRQRAEVRVGVGEKEVCCEDCTVYLSNHFNMRPALVGDGRLTRVKEPKAEPNRGGDSYEILVLGDTHYDAAYDVYHAKYQETDERLNRIQREEFARNERLWRVFGPRLLGAMKARVSERTRAVLQVGDLVQGDCGDASVHGRMLLDTLEMFHEQFPHVPFVTVIGNHDIRGPGAESAYQKNVLPYLSKELGQKVSSTTFSFMLGQDLVVCIDFNSPDVMAIQEAFDVHPEARYKFVLTHGPVIPIETASSGWFLLGWSDAAERRKIRELFLQNDVIVLTGHEHAVGLSECWTDSGRITQLMANSMWSEETLKNFTDEECSVAEFGRLSKPENNKRAQSFVTEYKDAMTRHWYAKGAGYMVLKISPKGITAEFFGGDGNEPARTVKVR